MKKRSNKSARKSVTISTFNKISNFLAKQTKPVFKKTIMENTGVNYDSLKLVLKIMEIKSDKEGRVSL